MAPGVKTRSASSTRKPPAASRAETVIYLYAISRERAADVQAAGVDGASRIEALDCSGLVCWISRVSARTFGEELNEHMQNLDWLASAGVRHQQAVAAIAANLDILPARFATIFFSADSLEHHIRSQKAVLRAALDRISGCEEWGVKVYAVAPPQAAAPDANNPASGRDYLQRKAALLRGRSDRHPADFTELADEFAAHTREAVRLPKQAAQPGLEWQASFLVHRPQREAFLAVATRFAKRWQDRHRIECTGPWPPYSFVASLGSEANSGLAQ